MNFKEEYQRKLMTADEAVKIIPNNSVVLTGIAGGQAVALVNAICRRQWEYEGVEIFYVVDVYGTEIKNLEPGSGVTADLNYPIVNRKLVQTGGNFYTTPMRFSATTKVWWRDRPISTTMHLVSPMDEFGYFTLAAGSGYELDAASVADHILVQVSNGLPRPRGDNFVHISQVDAVVEQDQKLFCMPEGMKPNANEVIIGQYCADLIEDESTIQLGIGGIPNAVATALENKRDLGVHSEMACETMLDLWEKGVITNRKKNFMPNRSIFTFAMGSQRLYDWIDDNPGIEFRVASFVNDPYIIGLNDKMVSINGCLEVDLTGQVVSDTLGPKVYTHPGGQLDFVNGCYRSKGGKSMLAFESTANTAEGPISRVTWQLTPGAAVTTPRSDTDAVVTEYGVARLYGQSTRSRCKQLIAIAHPDFRDELTFQAKKLGLLP